MTTAITIAELFDRGTTLSVAEAVAVVQSLVRNCAGSLDTADVHEPYGPPAPENIELRADGSAVCTGCATTPAVSELGIVLQQLLKGAPKIPGGLRYAVGRALLDVEAPPYDSLAEFSRSLARFEAGEPQEVLKALVERSGGRLLPMTPPKLVSIRPTPAVPKPVPAVPERRLHGPRPDQLRRELRAADERLYARVHASADVQPFPGPAAAEAGTAAPRRSVWRTTVAAAAVVLLATVFGTARFHRAPAAVQKTPVAAVVAARRAPVSGPAVAIAKPAAPQRPAATVTSPVPTGTSARSDVSAPAAEPVSRTPSRQPQVVDNAASDEPAVTNVSERHVRSGAEQEDGWLVPTLDINQRPVFSPSFATNGSAVFFHTGRTNDARSALMSADTTGDQLRVMTIVDDGSRNYHVQPSPDGRLIAFDSDRDGDRGVYVANRDGSNVHRVSGPGFAAVPTWSPDGSRLAYVRAEKNNARVWNLWLQTLATGATERLTDYRYGQPWSASWFPDGRRIAYTHEDRLFIEDLATHQTQSFASPVAGHLVRTPAVSPDGTKIIFQVYRNGAWLLDLTDGSTRCVLQDATAEEFAWAPDGRRVAFHSRRDGQWGIYVMAKRN